MTTPQTAAADSPPGGRERETADETFEAVRRELHAFIRETFLQLRPSLQFGDADDLVETGVLDSLAFVELVAEIQSRYGVTIRDTDITAENFGSVAAMAGYVRGRLSA